jgi:hypothetical protein
VKNIKSQIDNTAPPRQRHLRKNAKKAQMEKERRERINHENRLLLNKMAAIVHPPTGNVNRNATSTTYKPGLRLSRNQVPVVDNWNPSANSYKKSMNIESRRRELEKVTAENYGILQRIQAQKAFYNTEGLRKDWKDNKAYGKNVRTFRKSPHFNPPTTGSINPSFQGQEGRSSVQRPHSSPQKRTPNRIKGVGVNGEPKPLLVLHPVRPQSRTETYSNTPNTGMQSLPPLRHHYTTSLPPLRHHYHHVIIATALFSHQALPFLSCPVLSCPFPSLSFPVLSLPCPFPSCPVPSRPVLSSMSR